MKKIICLILMLTFSVGCIFAMVSCEKDVVDEPKDEPKTLYTIAKESVPTKIVTFVEYETKDRLDLDGEYVMEIEGNNSITKYDYKRFRTPQESLEDGSTERIKNVKGTVYFKDGLYSYDGKAWDAEPLEQGNINFKFDLNPEYLTDAKISEDGKTLTAKLSPENAEKTLGTRLSADGNIDFTVTTNGTYLTSVTLSCKTASGAKLAVRTSYSYNPITLAFPQN